MGISPIITRGYLFTIALVTTAGYGTGTPPPAASTDSMNKQFLGEVQQLGISSIFDASTGIA